MTGNTGTGTGTGSGNSGQARSLPGYRQLLQKRPPSGVDWNFKRSRPDKLPPSSAVATAVATPPRCLPSSLHLLFLIPLLLNLSLSLSLSLVSLCTSNSFSLCCEVSLFRLGEFERTSKKCYLVYYNDVRLLGAYRVWLSNDITN